MARDAVGTKTGTPIPLTLSVDYDPARPPLRLAFDPEDMPGWDWTRGFSPWSSLLLAPVSRLAEEHPEVFRAVVASANDPVLSKEAEAFLEPTPPPRLRYPRLVRASPEIPPLPPPSQPVYIALYRLFQTAKRHSPERGHQRAWGEALLGVENAPFARAVLETASRVGLLDPYGRDDDLEAWCYRAAQVGFYVDLMRAVREGFGLEAALETMPPPPARWLRGYAHELKRHRQALRAFQSVGRSYDVSTIAAALYRQAMNQILPRLVVGEDGRVKARVGAWAWAMLELSHALTDRRVRFCPVCGAPFLGRADRETCRSDRCRKRWYRTKKGSK